MGVYNRAIFSTSESERIASLIAYLNNLNSEESTIISAEEGTLEIDGATYTGASFELTGTDISGFFGYNGLQYTACCLKNGNNYLIPDTAKEDANTANLSVNTYIDDNCIYIAINDLNANNTGLEFVLLNISESKTLIGYKELNIADEIADISTLIFEDIGDTARVQYTYTNMFPYVAISGTIDFLAQSYFVNGGVKKFQSNFLRECSTVNIKSTASLPDGNYIALGAHCLAPLDDEEEEVEE
jgi:hypothetical protein